MAQRHTAVKNSIDSIVVTEDCLTGRAGLTLISKYLQAIGITAFLADRFAFLKKN